MSRISVGSLLTSASPRKRRTSKGLEHGGQHANVRLQNRIHGPSMQPFPSPTETTQSEVSKSMQCCSCRGAPSTRRNTHLSMCTRSADGRMRSSSSRRVAAAAVRASPDTTNLAIATRTMASRNCRRVRNEAPRGGAGRHHEQTTTTRSDVTTRRARAKTNRGAYRPAPGRGGGRWGEGVGGCSITYLVSNKRMRVVVGRPVLRDVAHNENVLKILRQATFGPVQATYVRSRRGGAARPRQRVRRSCVPSRCKKSCLARRTAA